MKRIVSLTLNDYKWLWKSWTGGMILLHLVVLGVAAFLVLLRRYQSGDIAAYWPGVPLAISIICILTLTAAAYE